MRGKRLGRAMAALVIGASVQAGRADPAAGDALAEQAYANHCAACHGVTLKGAFGPPLIEKAFHDRWAKQSPQALLSYIKTRMPPAKPGGLSDAEYLGATNLILARNGLGSLPADVAVNVSATVKPEGSDAGGAGAAADNEDAAFQALRARHLALLSAMTPVSEDMLRAPADGDWLNWRRTDDGLAYSPLKSIDVKTARHLQVAWSLALPAGTNQITPLVHDGVMFVNSSGTVQALDARDGDVLWKFSRQSAAVTPAGPPLTQPRNLAIWGTSLIVPTMDNHMLALDARTGTLLWDHDIEPSPAAPGVLRLTGGPIVVHGNIIQGVAGCAGAVYPGGCFIVALDARTGAEKWRFNTIPRPGTPEGDTWNSAPPSERYGASVWTPATYDPALNLLYVGTGQTYHIAPLITPKPRRPGAADALYTDTTLALDPDTGKLVWHFQHLARDVWDLDFAFERTLATVDTAHGPTRAVLTMGKLGILDALDAKTGRYLFSFDAGLQDLVTKIDPRTGRKSTDPRAEPQAGVEKTICPFPAGARTWPATAFDPSTRILYVPMFESCMHYTWKPGEGWDIQYTVLPRADSDGKFGRVEAIDIGARKPTWTVRRRASQASAIVATAGGVIFEGSRDRWFRASNSATGDILWQTRLDMTPNASPIVYGVADEEYVAITTGGGGPIDVSPQTLTPEINNPTGNTTLWVFKGDAHAD